MNGYSFDTDSQQELQDHTRIFNAALFVKKSIIYSLFHNFRFISTGLPTPGMNELQIGSEQEILAYLLDPWALNIGSFCGLQLPVWQKDRSVPTIPHFLCQIPMKHIAPGFERGMSMGLGRDLAYQALYRTSLSCFGRSPSRTRECIRKCKGNCFLAGQSKGIWTVLLTDFICTCWGSTIGRVFLLKKKKKRKT